MRDDNSITLKRLADLRADLLERLRQVDGVIAQLNGSDVESKPQESLKVFLSHSTEDVIKFPVGSLRGMTQTEALLTIAKHYDGVVRTEDLKIILRRAGLMKETKNAAHIVYNLISRSGKFERVANGVYRLSSREHPFSETAVPINAV